MNKKFVLLVAAAYVSSATVTAQVPTGQLPREVRPIAYRLELREDPAQPRFTGHVEIDVELSKAARSLYLNGQDLEVSKAVVRVGGRSIAATYAQVDAGGVARLDLAAEVPAGRATLVIDYGRDFRTFPGLYRVQAGGRWYSYTQFQPIDARTAFPSFDEPGFKTPFTISLTLPSGLTAVSNAPEVSATTNSDGWVTHRFAPTLPLPAYLVAFMAGPFATASGTVAANAHRAVPLPLRIVGTQPQAGKLAFALRETKPIVAALEGYFGDAFPFPKLDQIGSPSMGISAMENAGADTYGDIRLLLGAHPSVSQQRDFGMVVAHELSHQWFGDLVTPAWWDDLWLNESFANWMGYRFGEAWRPGLGIANGAVERATGAMSLDSLRIGRPVRQPIATARDSYAAFDEVTYGKGGMVLTQTAAFLGDDAFRAGVRLHLRRHRYGGATGDQFFQALSDAARNPKVTASLQSFVNQAGIPLMTFTRWGTGWTATQSRYALLGDAVPAQTWIVPLCVRTLDAKRRCTLADKATTTLTKMGTAPIVPNAGGTGYYRFELPAADWTALVSRMDTLPPAEAMMVTDSLWASFAAGRASPGLLIEAARHSAAHPDGAVVLDSAVRLAAWPRRGFVTDNALAAYRGFMASTYGPLLTKLGLDLRVGAYADAAAGPAALRSGLVAIMAAEARDIPLRQQLAEAATRYLAGDTAALDEAFLPSALTVYVEEHDLAEAVKLLKRAEATDDAVFRTAAIGAVGAGARIVGVADAEALVFKSSDTKRLQGQLAGALAGRADTRAVAEAVVLPRLAEFGRYMPTFSSYGRTASFDQACSADEAARIEAAYRPQAAVIIGGDLAVSRIVERVETCGVLKDKRGVDITAALADR